MRFWIQMQLLSLRLTVLSIKLAIRDTVATQKKRWHRRVVKVQGKVRASRRKAARAAKDMIIPSLPGVSKLKLPVPPAPHLLLSNDPPTDAERVLVNKAIANAEIIVLQLKHKLGRRIAAGVAQRGWETVTRHKIGQATRFVQQHQGINSSLRRLPVEILQEIFFCATASVRAHNRYRTVSELPWSLSHVCAHWRSAALSVSTLWCYIPTLQLKKSRQSTRRQIDYVTELVRRSRQAPLDIYISSPYYDRKSHPILDVLLQHSDRWKTLTIEATLLVISGFRAAKGRLGQLQCLTLQTPWHRYLDVPPTSLDTFEVAPQLQTVSVSGPFVGYVKLPFSQLTCYKERRIFSNLMTEVVSSALLESLTLLELSDHIIFPPVTLPHLKTLQVKFESDSFGGPLDNLTLPMIEEIRAVVPLGNLVARLTSMISRSGLPCPLKVLSIRTEYIEPGDLSTLLRLTPELEELDTSISQSNNFVDIACLANKECRPLVPHLESCRFYIDESISAETVQALNDLAAFRCDLENDNNEDGLLVSGDVKRLKHLSVYFDTTSSPWNSRQQADLEGWAYSVTAHHLDVVKTQLIFALPDLMNAGLALSGFRDKPWSKKVCERVEIILNVIDGIAVDDPMHIYSVGIHFTLQQLSEMQFVPNSPDANLCKRAREILDKWHPMFLTHLHKRHWAFRGPLCMGYVPKNDPIRTSPDALNIIYGLKDEMALQSIFWPTFMSYT